MHFVDDQVVIANNKEYMEHMEHIEIMEWYEKWLTVNTQKLSMYGSGGRKSGNGRIEQNRKIRTEQKNQNL